MAKERWRPTPLWALLLCGGVCLLEWMTTGKISPYNVLKSAGLVTFLWIAMVGLDLWSGWVFIGETARKDFSPATTRQKDITALGLLIAYVGNVGLAFGLSALSDKSASQNVVICFAALALGGLSLSMWGVVKAANNYRLTPREDVAADNRVNLAWSCLAGSTSYGVILSIVVFCSPELLSSWPWAVLVGWILIVGIFYLIFCGLLKTSIEAAVEESLVTEESASDDLDGPDA